MLSKQQSINQSLINTLRFPFSLIFISKFSYKSCFSNTIIFFVQDRIGKTLLSHCIEQHNTELVRLLVEHGARVNQIRVRLHEDVSYNCLFYFFLDIFPTYPFIHIVIALNYLWCSKSLTLYL